MSTILRNMRVMAFVESMRENVDKAIAAKPEVSFNIATDAHALRHLLAIYERVHREKPEWLVE